MNLKNHIFQVYVILSISIVISLTVNLLSSKPLPLLSKELEQAETIDFDTDEPVLQIISLEQAREFYEKDILFLDARDEAYFNKGHIKGSLKNIFFMELLFNIESLQSKQDPLVVYCGDPGCGDSEDLAYNLQDAGFTKLYVFKGGWLEWSAAEYPSESIK
jgi:rhodanese-related sulfurtransferase